MQCDQCLGVGSTSTGRYESCGRCGGSGQGAAMDVACMACGGTGRSTTEVRDTCWNCHGSGSLPDPQPAARSRSAQPAARQPASAAAPSTTAGGQAPARPATATKRVILAISLVVGGVVGFLEYSKNSETIDAVVAGAIAFGLTMIGLYVLLFVFKVLVQAAKVAVPVAVVLLIGNLMQWQWAQDATDWLLAVGGSVVEAAEKAWDEIPNDGRAADDASAIPPSPR